MQSKTDVTIYLSFIWYGKKERDMVQKKSLKKNNNEKIMIQEKQIKIIKEDN